MIGRSKSSIVDQLEYVPERIAEIQQSTVPLQFAGRTYTDIVRFYSGKLYMSGRSQHCKAESQNESIGKVNDSDAFHSEILFF